MVQSFDFTGIADGTDLASVTGWSRADGASGAVTIQSGAAQLGGNTTETAYTVDTSVTDHSFEVDLEQPGIGESGSNDQRSFFCCRLTDHNNFIGFRLYQGKWDLYQRVGGTFTLVEEGGADTDFAGRYRLEVDDEIRLYRDDVLLNTPATPDASFASVTTVGVVNRGNGNDEAAFDNVTVGPTQENLGAGGWTWFHEPRAISDGTNTYYGGLTLRNEVKVFQRNNTTGDIDEFTVKSGTGWGDDHADPTFLIRPDGRLVVFYAQHNGSAMFYRVSTNVGDATAWGAEQSVTLTGITYPNPVMLSGESNRVYVFFRNLDRDLTYIYSDDLDTVASGSAATWSSEQAMILGGAGGCYFKAAHNGTDRIDFGLTDAVLNSSATGKEDIRHVYFSAETLYASDGTEIGNKAGGDFPVAFSTATAVATSDAPDNLGDIWIWDIARDDDTGVIQVVFAQMVSGTDHRYYYARYETGTGWSTAAEIDTATRSGRITDSDNIEAFYSPGICLDHALDGVVYISVGDNDASQVWRYTTTDGGSTWTSERITDSEDLEENIRPVVPRNRHDDCGVLWLRGRYGYFDFSESGGYAVGVRKAAAPVVATDATATPSGVSGTGAVGTVTVAAEITATASPAGVAGTGAVGAVSISADATAAPTGVSGTGEVGTAAVALDSTASPAGVSGAGHVGTVTAFSGTSVEVSGVSASGQIGSASVTLDSTAAVEGVSATGAVGSVSTSTGTNDNATPTGVSGTGQIGSVGVNLDSTAAVEGVSGSGQVGSVVASSAADASVVVTGVFGTGGVGSVAVGISKTVAISGVSGVGGVGSVVITLSPTVAPSGVSASGAVGTVTIHGANAVATPRGPNTPAIARGPHTPAVARG